VAVVGDQLVTCAPDNTAFIDEKGGSPEWLGRCSDWADYDCTHATTVYTYSEQGANDLLKNCPVSCGLCMECPSECGAGQTRTSESWCDGVSECGNCCKEKECTCEYGTPATGAACTTDGTAKCVKCPAGYGMNGHACEKCTGTNAANPQFNAKDDESPCGDHTPCPPGKNFSYSDITGDVCNECASNTYSPGGFGSCTPHVEDCNAAGKTVATPASSSADATCGQDKECICDNGTPAIGQTCDMDGVWLAKLGSGLMGMFARHAPLRAPTILQNGHAIRIVAVDVYGMVDLARLARRTA
jgi:hypothetical protein